MKAIHNPLEISLINEFSGSCKWYGLYNPLEGKDYKWYILPIGWLYTTDPTLYRNLKNPLNNFPFVTWIDNPHEQWKKPWLVVFIGDYTTQIYGVYNKPLQRISFKQPVFHGKYPAVFFFNCWAFTPHPPPTIEITIWEMLVVFAHLGSMIQLLLVNLPPRPYLGTS